MKVINKIKSWSGIWLSVLAVGVALGGYFIGNGIYRAMSGRTVTVKGLAERDVVADTAVWSIKINGVGGDLGTLQQQIDNDIAEIHTFLTDAGGLLQRKHPKKPSRCVQCLWKIRTSMAPRSKE